RGEQLALTDAPVGRPAHHGLRPLALRRAEEFGPVHQRLDDVGHPPAAQDPDEREDQLVLEAMTVLHSAHPHQSGSSPRTPAMPRSNRCSAAPTAAATVISKMVSSEWPPACCSAATSASVTL